MKIYKYILDFRNIQIINAKIIKPLSIQLQNKKVYLWAIVDETEINCESVIRLYETGSKLDIDYAGIELNYISSLQLGSFVFHYFMESNNLI